jgi:poly(A) polymerase
MLKLLQTGHALASVEQLKSAGLGRGIYPLLDLVVQRAEEPFVRLALQDTDRRVGEGKPVAPSFLLACVLWTDVREAWARHQAGGEQAFGALQQAVDDAFDARIGDVSGRGKLGADMREIWMMQPRFDRRTGSSVFTLIEQPRFRAGFDFLRLRAQTGEVEEELAHWWETFSTASETVRRDMVDAVRQEQAKSKGGAKAQRVRRVPAGAPTAAPADDPRWREVDSSANDNDVAEPGTDWDAGAVPPDGTAPARKRRRRRRKPAGGEGGTAAPAADDSAGD